MNERCSVKKSKIEDKKHEYHDEGLHPYVNGKDGKSRWARVQWPCQDEENDYGPTSIGRWSLNWVTSCLKTSR